MKQLLGLFIAACVFSFAIAGAAEAGDSVQLTITGANFLESCSLWATTSSGNSQIISDCVSAGTKYGSSSSNISTLEVRYVVPSICRPGQHPSKTITLNCSEVRKHTKVVDCEGHASSSISLSGCTDPHLTCTLSER